MSKERGFSLVEAIVALFLVIITAIVLLNIFPASRKGLQLSENRVSAASLGSSILEDARKKKFDNISTSTGSFEYKGTDNGSPFSQNFNYKLNVQLVNPDTKLLWVDVTWTEATGSKKATVETIRTKTGDD